MNLDFAFTNAAFGVLLLLLPVGCKPTSDVAPASGVSGVTTTAASATPAPTVASAAPAPTAAPTHSATVAASAKAPSPSSSAAGAGYFWNEPTVVVEGTLVHKLSEFSSAPVPVVVFDHPITIKPKAGDDTPPLVGAKEAWLSYNGIDKAAVTKLYGKKVTYKGALNPSQTAHHLSNPWLDGTITAR